MRDTFCILPWNHLEVKPTGTLKICCVAANEVQVNGHAALAGQDSFTEIWNSDHMQKVRRALLEGKPVADCSYCYRQEAAQTAPSLRERNNFEWMQHYQTSRDGLVQLAQNLGSVVNLAPAYLQLSLGNECNLKCRMCCSDYSSQIEHDPVHYQWAPSSPSKSKTWHKDDDLFVDELFSQPKNIRKLYITGGEPMMSNRFQKILDLLIEQGHPEQVDIQINTNGTVFNPRILERLAQFKAVLLGCSIDGYQDDYEYIRYPAKWSTVLKTVDRFREHKKFNVGFYPTIQAYNALHITELYGFCDANDLVCIPQVMYGPEHLTVLVMPQAARDLAASRLDQFIQSPAVTGRQRESRQHAVPVRDYLQHTAEPKNVRDLARSFAIFTNDLDRSRGQNFKATHKELFDCFLSSELGWTEEVRFYSENPASDSNDEREKRDKVVQSTADTETDVPRLRRISRAIKQWYAGRA